MEALGIRGSLQGNLRMIFIYVDNPPTDWTVDSLRPVVQEFLVSSLGIPLTFVDESTIDPDAPLNDTQYFNLLLMKELKRGLATMMHAEDGSVKPPTIKLTLEFNLIVHRSSKRIDPSTARFLVDAEKVESLQPNKLRELLEPDHAAMFQREFDSYDLYVPDMPLYCIANKSETFTLKKPLTPQRVFQIEMIGKVKRVVEHSE